MSTAELTASVLALPLDEKAALADRLLADLTGDVPPEISTAQTSEVMRRREEVFSGKVQLIPGDQVMRELDAMLNEISRVSPRSPR
jgi:hypothetical protein